MEYVAGMGATIIIHLYTYIFIHRHTYTHVFTHTMYVHTHIGYGHSPIMVEGASIVFHSSDSADFPSLGGWFKQCGYFLGARLFRCHT